MTEKTTQLTPEMVVRAVNEVLSVKRQSWESVQADTPLESLELDSLDLAEVFATLEERSGLDLDPDSAREIETVADLAQLRAL
ncbi:MAG TPA: acyl carrier protein [Solirubrobacteraceae bacterium]|jgi:acyl carrier protein|nr:acyl carrier protein [Solirubrobacteraceae bacterium]